MQINYNKSKTMSVSHSLVLTDCIYSCGGIYLKTDIRYYLQKGKETPMCVCICT